MSAKPSNSIKFSNISFGHWVSNYWRMAILIVPTIYALLVGLYNGFIWMDKRYDWAFYRPSIFIIQCLFCLIILFLIPEAPKNMQKSPRASIAMKQFESAWKIAWLFWFIMYLVLSIHEIAILMNPGLKGVLNNWYWNPCKNLLFNMQTMAVIILYYIMAKATVKEGIEPSKLPWDKGVAIVVLLTSVDFFCSAPGLAEVHFLSDMITRISAIGAGLTFALIVGEMANVYIGLGTWTITLLYCYAVVQVQWKEFESPNLETIMISIALVMKCLWFLVLTWMMQNGRLLFYFEKMAKNCKKIGKERDEYIKSLHIDDINNK